MRRREKTDGNKETDMEGEAGAKQLRERLLNAQKILVGIGMEWDPKTPERKAKITTAAETLRRLLSGRDYYVITSLEEEGALALGIEKEHMAAPFCVSFTEEDWKNYTAWLAGTLNRNLVLLELGEDFKNPSLIRWPFEKTAMLNQKAVLFRVHKSLSQIPDTLKEKAVSIAADSVEFLLACGITEEKDEQEGTNGCD